jgi:non-homologous end joining protein Ku
MAVSRRKEKVDALPMAMAGLSSRPAWQGHLRLSLVNCAVGLYKAKQILEPRETGNVVDLMESLRKSLRGKPEPATRPAFVSKLPRRKVGR